MNIYLAGSMRNEPGLGHEFFDKVSDLLIESDPSLEIFNPAQVDRLLGISEEPKGKEHREVIGCCMEFIINKADRVYLLPGWTNSRAGVWVEIVVASLVDIPIYQIELENDKIHRISEVDFDFKNPDWNTKIDGIELQTLNALFAIKIWNVIGA